MSFNRNFVVVWLIHCSLPFLSFSSISCVCVCCVYFWAAWHGFGCVRHQFCCNYIAAAVKTIANCCTPIDTHLPVFPELQARKKKRNRIVPIYRTKSSVVRIEVHSRICAFDKRCMTQSNGVYEYDEKMVELERYGKFKAKQTNVKIKQIGFL